jgi:protoheme IX farnesyltransferase
MTVASIVRDYISLTKPRIMPLLLIVTFASMIIAADGNPEWTAVIATMIGGALAIGGASAINGFVDRDVDRRMTRTQNRPIPAGRISPRSALLFGVVLGLGSVLLFVLTVNVLAAAITLAAIFYYAVIYSRLLKHSTTQNIVIGGAAGAAPALIGWAAATNGLGLTALLLFAIVFYWTPPHFWALALLIRHDYRKAGIPMLPAVAGKRETKRQIILYTLLMVALTLMLIPASAMGFLYLVTAVVLGALFLILTLLLARSSATGPARALFSYSMVYLAILFGAMALDKQLSLPT